jgi:diguanylate cyclase (GGDEF)-like protein
VATFPGPIAALRPRRFPPEVELEFRDGRIAGLAAVNANTFWFMAVIVMAFGMWDWYVDRDNWVAAVVVRILGAAIIIGTGIFQKLPGKSLWMPSMAKVRLITAVVTAASAAALLERGYGFGIAGLVVILLTGPYTAIDSRDLTRTNIIALVALGLVLPLSPLDGFEVFGTIVFVLLAVAVSSLLGRVLESSHRRAFALERELHRDARTDSLTGLANRRAMEERGPLELKRAQRSTAPVSVILCDVDHFKNINDRYGHEAGDAVLRTVAGVLRGTLRETDALARWGGEEFIAVLADTDTHKASEIAERMRTAVNRTAFGRLPEGATISLGVSTVHKINAASSAWEGLIKEADLLLYQAKKEGRNRVMYPQA